DCAAWLAKARQADVLLRGIPETRPSDRVRRAVLGSTTDDGRRTTDDVASSVVRRPSSVVRRPQVSGWRLEVAGMLLRFDPSPQRIALAFAAALLSLVGIAYWLNMLPPLWGYSKFGFLLPHEQEQV